MIVGVCALLTLISLAASRATPPDRQSIVRQYPLSAGNQPVQLALEHTDTQEGKFAPIYNDEVSIQLPMSVAGIPEDTFLGLDGMIVTLMSANGFRWDSGWKTDAQWLFPQQKTTNLSFQVKRSIFDQLNSGPVTARLLLAFTLYRNQNRHQFIVPTGRFTLPEVGVCTTELQYSRGIHCMAPLRRPAFLLVTSESSSSTCAPDGAETSRPNGIFLHDFVRGGPGPAEMGISPVRPFDIVFSDWDWSARRPVSPGICPGTPLTLSNPEVAGHRGVELQMNNVSLDEFRERNPAGP